MYLPHSIYDATLHLASLFINKLLQSDLVSLICHELVEGMISSSWKCLLAWGKHYNCVVVPFNHAHPP